MARLWGEAIILQAIYAGSIIAYKIAKREALQTIKVIVVCEFDRFMDRQSDCRIHRAGNSFIFSSSPLFMHGTIRRLVPLIAAPSMVHQFRVSFIRGLLGLPVIVLV